MPRCTVESKGTPHITNRAKSSWKQSYVTGLWAAWRRRVSYGQQPEWTTTQKYVSHTLKQDTVPMAIAAFSSTIGQITNLATSLTRNTRRRKDAARESSRMEARVDQTTGSRTRMLTKSNQTRKLVLMLTLKDFLMHARSARTNSIAQFKQYAATISAKNVPWIISKQAKTVRPAISPQTAFSTKQRIWRRA